MIEFGGPVISKLSMGARITMTNMVVEAGGTCGMMMVDETTAEYLWPVYEKFGDEFTNCISLEKNLAFHFNSDADAEYDKVIEIDVTDMVPLAAINTSPGDVVPVF